MTDDWSTFAYTFVSGAMLTLSIIGLESAAVTPSLGRWDKRFFTTFFAILVLSSLCFFPEWVAYANPELVAVQALTYFLESILYVIPFPLVAAYMLHCCGEDWRGNPFVWAMLTVLGAYTALLVVAQFTGLIDVLAPIEQIYLQPGYFVLLTPAIAMLFLIVAAVLRRRDKMPHHYYRALLTCLLPVTIALFVHFFVPAFTLINVGLTICAYAMYRIIIANTIEEDARRQRELVNQRASIAVLQMRPHFIYNTMTSIYYLCDRDPQLAKQVTMDFTTYLRRNLNAIASEDTIPFPEELEHTRAYLAVEQAQFEDSLAVSYDTPHTLFRVPPLTLQPLVENAVKHAMDPDSGPLHIWVRTSNGVSGAEIVVEDDGAGFDPAIADDPHTTLANIRQRLKMMCGGTLAIEPRKGGGTVVKAIVPPPHQVSA